MINDVSCFGAITLLEKHGIFTGREFAKDIDVIQVYILQLSILM